MPVGLLKDDAGTPMTPTHANKKGTRYRYYVSRDTGRWRVPAGDLEGLVAKRLCQFFGSEAELFAAIETMVDDANDRADLLKNGAALQQEWSKHEPAHTREILVKLVERIVLKLEGLEMRLYRQRTLELLSDRLTDPATLLIPGDADSTITLTLPVRLKRAGIETRLIIDGEDQGARRQTDHSLRRLIALGYEYREMVLHSGKPISELAAEAGVGRSYFSRILRLGFMAPDAIKTILADKHPLELTADKLAKNSRLPICWNDQKDCLGMRSP